LRFLIAIEELSRWLDNRDSRSHRCHSVHQPPHPLLLCVFAPLRLCVSRSAWSVKADRPVSVRPFPPELALWVHRPRGTPQKFNAKTPRRQEL